MFKPLRLRHTETRSAQALPLKKGRNFYNKNIQFPRIIEYVLFQNSHLQQDNPATTPYISLKRKTFLSRITVSHLFSFFSFLSSILFSLYSLFYLKIPSMSFNSSSLKSRFCKASTLFLSCSTLLAPTSTEVTR